jgi:hypothetical protein
VPHPPGRSDEGVAVRRPVARVQLGSLDVWAPRAEIVPVRARRIRAVEVQRGQVYTAAPDGRRDLGRFEVGEEA